LRDELPREGWSTASAVSFVAQTFLTVRMTHPDAAALTAVGKILRSLYLHREIREKGGAYGGFAVYNPEKGLFCLGSYRDPHILSTLKVYEGVGDFIRSGTYDEEDVKEAILQATREMLYIIIRANELRPEDVASAYFTTTVDLNATYPALAARQLGWYDVALLCGHEMLVPGGLNRCIRVLIHWNTTRSADQIVHVYLREAKNLRPDRKSLPEIHQKELEQIIRDFDMSTLKFNPDGIRK